jgi:hypothetical protein
LGFIDETELGNNKTCCSSKSFHLTGTEEHNLTSTGIHPNNSRHSNTNIKFREKMFISPQMTRHLNQQQVYGDSQASVVEETRRCYEDAVDTRRLNTNIESKKTLMKTSVKLQKQSTKEYSLAPIPKEPDKRVQGAENGERATGIAAISNRRGNDEQTASRGHPYMDNMAIPSLQQQLLDDWHVPAYKETRHHHRDAVHGGQPNMNDKQVEQLTNTSGRVVIVSREGRDDVCTSYGGHKKLTEENISK